MSAEGSEALVRSMEDALQAVGETRRRFFREAEEAGSQELSGLFWELGDAEEVLLGVLERVEG